MNIACVIVTYNPDRNFDLRLTKIREEFDIVIIVDNVSDPPLKINDSDVIVIRNSSNLGIATALNQGVITAAASGVEYVCLFDQDSTIEAGFKNILLDGFSTSSNIAIVAANYVNPISNKQGYTIKVEQDMDSYSNIDHAITSGSMIKISALKICGLMRDDYFIDYVDVEFCERVRSSGFSILCTNEPLMEHPIGDATNHTLFGYRLSASNHSPLRRYYMTRNCLYSIRQNFNHNRQFSIISLNRLLRVILVTLLFEKRKSMKAKAMLWGLFDGFTDKMGRSKREL